VSAVRQMALWPELRSRTGALLAAALALSLIRARDQPGFDVAFGGTTATIVPLDLVLAVLLVVAAVMLVRAQPVSLALAALGCGAVFAALVLATAAANGAAPLVAAVKIVELAALGAGAVVLVRREGALEAIVDVLLLFTLAGDVVGLVQFFRDGGGRQAAFFGEHDFAAVAILPLLYGLGLVFEGRRGTRAALCIVAGGLGCVLGAALASLVGLYLGAAVLVVAALTRRRLSLRPLLVTAATLVLVTGGTVAVRGNDLSFLRAWFGPPASRPGEYAGSWSQRLIYAYVGGRVFLDHPLLGTGWYPELPGKEYAQYLPDARQRFADQPPSYFPPAEGTFIPQQAYDQVLYELGAVGAAALLALIVAVTAAAVRTARRARTLADLPLAWVAATLGALAGEGLFGGTPLAATFWLTFGVAVASLGWRAQ
jgi:O-antigen ligase/polysaccharide polymerase Wzy-like membrane protein